MNRGKGFSVKNGFMHAKGKLLVFSDADLSTPIEEVSKLLNYYNEGYDVVIGSRGMKDSDIQIHQPWYRELMGRIFNFFVVLLAIHGFKDTQCGFKGFRREAALEICMRQRMEGFSFDVEMLYIAKKLGYRIKEVPIQWFDSPQTKVNTLKDSRKMFMDLLRVRINDWKGVYS
jgi:dolichyl-phosphate beta-glucosyltransferase